MIMIRKIALPFLFTSIFSVAFIADKKAASAPPHLTETGFALVELFTSEGCSSCPPADALLARIGKENSNKPVYLLAYHVDYWNRLGWKDRFSSAKFSARQNQYGDWLNLKTIYTPQMVVNGSKEFIGSEEVTLRNSIKAALAQPLEGNLEISTGKTIKHKLTLNYRTNQQTDGYSLAVALISTKATSRVLKGENKGLTLTHVNIVRQFESFALQGKTSGAVNIEMEQFNEQMPTELIAFLQDNKTGKITAAAKLGNLPAPM